MHNWVQGLPGIINFESLQTQCQWPVSGEISMHNAMNSSQPSLLDWLLKAASPACWIGCFFLGFSQLRVKYFEFLCYNNYRMQVQLLHETVRKPKLNLPELVKIQVWLNVHAAQIWQHENQQLNIYDIILSCWFSCCLYMLQHRYIL